VIPDRCCEQGLSLAISECDNTHFLIVSSNTAALWCRLGLTSSITNKLRLSDSESRQSIRVSVWERGEEMGNPEK
jgi:hypothetical protein